MEETTYLFVYGTLLSNHRAHGYLDGCKFIGNATTKDSRYNMESYNGHFPMVFTEGTYKIKGEIYEIPKHLLSDLDYYEGYNGTQSSLYKRDYFNYILENGDKVEALMYYQSENKDNIKSKINILEENRTYRWR